MPDQLEQSLREALSQRAAQLDPTSITRLSAIDYHPRRRRFGVVSAVSALGVGGAAAALTAVFALSSGAAPAFAGWSATPTTPAPGQLVQAAQACGQDLGKPVLTDSRGPYTASIYADATTSDVCLSGNGVSMSSQLDVGVAGHGAGGSDRARRWRLAGLRRARVDARARPDRRRRHRGDDRPQRRQLRVRRPSPTVGTWRGGRAPSPRPRPRSRPLQARAPSRSRRRPRCRRRPARPGASAPAATRSAAAGARSTAAMPPPGRRRRSAPTARVRLGNPLRCRRGWLTRHSRRRVR